MFVRLALKVVMQNDGDFVNLTLLYVTDIAHACKQNLFYIHDTKNNYLGKCFPIRVTHNVVRFSTRNREINTQKFRNTAKNYKYPSCNLR
jgi:hypothetical protein